MKKYEECKLIQDLLPNYVDKVTSEETNEYIENHIKNCDDCSRILKELGEDIVLDKIDNMKKIDYLRKIKKRNLSVIAVISGIAIILIIIMFSFFSSLGGVELDENGKPEYVEAFKQWISGTNKITSSDVTNLLLISKDEKVDATIIMTFDKNNICIGARYCVGGYTEKEAAEKYKELKNSENLQMPTITNTVLKKDKVVYNYNYWNGKNKDQILNELLKDYNYEIKEM